MEGLLSLGPTPSSLKVNIAHVTTLENKIILRGSTFHIVPHRKFDRIGGTSSAPFPNFRYVAPREICVERNSFDSPIAK